MEYLAIILFILIFILILRGYPVAFTLGGISVAFAFGVSILAPEVFQMSTFYLLPSRIMGVVNNYVLMAVPLFIFMGIMLEKSGLAQSLLETMAMMFGRVRGGLAISVVIVGALLAASTGIVGATVVTMGLISLPTMLKRGYKTELATGVIASSGTLGQIIPPSIVLVLLADTINSSSRGAASVDVGALFSAALLPGGILVVLYIVYILIKSSIHKDDAPSIPAKEIKAFRGENFGTKIIKVLFLPILLIALVLGSIFTGIASPTEASAIGAIGATVLTIVQKKFSLSILKEVAQETAKLTSMVFFILLGATTFTLVFRTLGGDSYLQELIMSSNLTPLLFLLLVMVVIFIAGFFIDFIEIVFIIVPVVTPIFNAYGMDMLWVGILIALNLQTSFLTPPFGFALFYLKGVAPDNVTTGQIYRGIIPFIMIQLIIVGIVVFFPEIIFISK
ncbi:TRAP transporter large permease subunit [Aquimarina sp. AD10]|uniref:TRAP transporter large permease n=1 Tax=Aquimarina TaxID=290174 RepID=UPI000E474E5B|nr:MULTISPECIES: TRAP transporter large permease subunit [Aquimarina]AXT63179.1 TRAP transporter large permease subunit [Aquimarina sp. AD10]RKM98606.1 TRAP transporter large permease subunit [Aquimarina sp. AD10]